MIVTSGKGNPGDVKSYSVKVNGKDITAQVLTAYIFQTIWAPTWSAQLIMNDANNLLVSIGIKVKDSVTISIETENGESDTNGKKEFSFEIYKISGRHFENHMQLTYTIDLVDSAFIDNAGKRDNTCYKDKYCYEIVTSLAIGTVKEIDRPTNKITFITPKLSPFHAINLVTKATSIDGNFDYVYFQLDKGVFAFRSLKRLYLPEPAAPGAEAEGGSLLGTIGQIAGGIAGAYLGGMQGAQLGSQLGAALGESLDGKDEEDTGAFEFRMKPAQQTLEKEGGGDFMKEFFNYIIDDEDNLTNEYAGFNKSKLATFDLKKKKFEKGSEGVIGFMPKHEGMSDGGPTMIDNASSWYSGRKETFKKMQDMRMTIQVPGGVAGWELIGKTVFVALPSEQDVISQVLDPKLAGKWLVTGITHNIGKHNYIMSYELLKYEPESGSGGGGMAETMGGDTDYYRDIANNSENVADRM